jgi:hypothetical protein
MELKRIIGSSWDFKKNNLGSDLLGWIRDAGEKPLNPDKGASPPDAAHVCHHPSG